MKRGRLSDALVDSLIAIGGTTKRETLIGRTIEERRRIVAWWACVGRAVVHAEGQRAGIEDVMAVMPEGALKDYNLAADLGLEALAVVMMKGGAQVKQQLLLESPPLIKKLANDMLQRVASVPPLSDECLLFWIENANHSSLMVEALLRLTLAERRLGLAAQLLRMERVQAMNLCPHLLLHLSMRPTQHVTTTTTTTATSGETVASLLVKMFVLHGVNLEQSLSNMAREVLLQRDVTLPLLGNISSSNRETLLLQWISSGLESGNTTLVENGIVMSQACIKMWATWFSQAAFREPLRGAQATLLCDVLKHVVVAADGGSAFAAHCAPAVTHLMREGILSAQVGAPVMEACRSATNQVFMVGDADVGAQVADALRQYEAGSFVLPQSLISSAARFPTYWRTVFLPALLRPQQARTPEYFELPPSQLVPRDRLIRDILAHRALGLTKAVYQEYVKACIEFGPGGGGGGSEDPAAVSLNDFVAKATLAAGVCDLNALGAEDPEKACKMIAVRLLQYSGSRNSPVVEKVPNPLRVALLDRVAQCLGESRTEVSMATLKHMARVCKNLQGIEQVWFDSTPLRTLYDCAFATRAWLIWLTDGGGGGGVGIPRSVYLLHFRLRVAYSLGAVDCEEATKPLLDEWVNRHPAAGGPITLTEWMDFETQHPMDLSWCAEDYYQEAIAVLGGFPTVQSILLRVGGKMPILLKVALQQELMRKASKTRLSLEDVLSSGNVGSLVVALPLVVAVVVPSSRELLAKFLLVHARNRHAWIESAALLHALCEYDKEVSALVPWMRVSLFYHKRVPADLAAQCEAWTSQGEVGPLLERCAAGTTDDYYVLGQCLFYELCRGVFQSKVLSVGHALECVRVLCKASSGGGSGSALLFISILDSFARRVEAEGKQSHEFFLKSICVMAEHLSPQVVVYPWCISIDSTMATTTGKYCTDRALLKAFRSASELFFGGSSPAPSWQSLFLSGVHRSMPFDLVGVFRKLIPNHLLHELG